MRLMIALLPALILFSFATPSAGAQAKHFRIRDDGGSRIGFTSDAPRETIDGVSSQAHPRARFQITGIRGGSRLRPNQEARVTVQGRFTIHGVTRRVTAEARVKWLPLTDEMRATPGIDGDVLRVRARFTVRLSDCGVDIPAVVRLEVSNELTVTADLRAIAE